MGIVVLLLKEIVFCVLWGLYIFINLKFVVFKIICVVVLFICFLNLVIIILIMCFFIFFFKVIVILFVKFGYIFFKNFG